MSGPKLPHSRKDASLLAASILITCLLLPAFLWFAAPYFTYQIYMGGLAMGVRGGYWRLPPAYAAGLAPFYGDDLATAAIARTALLPRNLAVADCKTVYFGDPLIVEHLRAGTALTRRELRWLAHELTHGEQCQRWGGRPRFARTWFSQAGTQAWRVVRSGGTMAGIREYLRTKNVADLHDAMPMEIEADERAARVLDDLR